MHAAVHAARSERRAQRRGVIAVALATTTGADDLELTGFLGDRVGDLLRGLFLLAVVVAVAEHAERAGDAAIGLQDDAGKDLLALLEAEPLDVEMGHADAPGVMAGVLAIVSCHALREPLEQVGDLAASLFGHLFREAYPTATEFPIGRLRGNRFFTPGADSPVGVVGDSVARTFDRGPGEWLRSEVMIVERSMSSEWLSNTYLVADEATGDAVMIDAGGPVAPLLEAIELGGYRLSRVLLTHHHHDHVAELEQVMAAHPGAPVLIHPLERSLVPQADGDLNPGQTLTLGGLEIEPLHTPGHTAGMVSLLAGGTDLFTGDTLFRGSVGGVRAPGHTTYADLRSSIMDTLLTLPAQTRIHPGHTDPTTVAEELETNRFVRIWRGLDPEGDRPCTALGEPATLILLGDDYDGGHKAWVRWPDGSDDIVPGSRVELDAT